MTKVAIQGFTGSFHAIAAEKMLGSDIELVMCDSFPNLFKALDLGQADYAVMAIENTIAGSILFNYSLLHQYQGLRIIAETSLKIEHFLMGLNGQELENIKEVRSHPMAIMQCMRFFRSYPEIRLVEDIDTAYMAQLISEKQTRGVAAIAGKNVAERFDLKILKANIEDSDRNFTRFLVLKKTITNTESGTNKATVSFSIPNEKGQLKKLMDLFLTKNVNIANIQSLPIVGKEWNYRFFCDLEYSMTVSEMESFLFDNHIQSHGHYIKGI
ncbi:MAG: prephenate dehydratase domain-containing protein [Bacteroidota bacterium]|nr:prephenate dehydratase domain-containing protein [Bacteroidota bacterium]